MNRRSVLAASAAALGGCTDLTDGPDPRAAETVLYDEIDAFRDREGRAPLPKIDTLAETAREHSRDMYDRDYYAHETPEGIGPSQRAGCRAGETIHRGEVTGSMRNQGSDKTWATTDAEGIAGYVAAGWRQSPPHAEILRDRRWQGVGVGIYLEAGEFFATALFC